MKNMEQVGRGAGMEAGYSGRGDVQPEELFTDGLNSFIEHIAV